ncbi:hypothetical protein [Saccharopolyspora hattusasensis]
MRAVQAMSPPLAGAMWGGEGEHVAMPGRVVSGPKDEPAVPHDSL